LLAGLLIGVRRFVKTSRAGAGMHGAHFAAHSVRRSVRWPARTVNKFLYKQYLEPYF